jgi:hypothetical protein
MHTVDEEVAHVFDLVFYAGVYVSVYALGMQIKYFCGFGKDGGGGGCEVVE